MNEHQQAAVEAKGHVFVSAGAGTGKTMVLVERFARAVCDDGVDVESILVITYTEKAAGELRSRIRAELTARGRPDLARALDGAWISTIHGFCYRLLRSHPFAAGVDPRFRVVDESQGRVLRGEAFEAALTEFCAQDDPARLRLLAVYGADGLRRMLTGVYETLRSAGRELVLELGGGPQFDAKVTELRDAAQCLADDSGSGETARETARQALVLLDADARAERLCDLGDLRVRGERAATYEESRRAVEQAALDELAAADRGRRCRPSSTACSAVTSAPSSSRSQPRGNLPIPSSAPRSSCSSPPRRRTRTPTCTGVAGRRARSRGASAT